MDTALGLVTAVRPAGVGLHVDHQGSASVSRSGTGAAPAYQQQSLERASASVRAFCVMPQIISAGVLCCIE